MAFAAPEQAAPVKQILGLLMLACVTPVAVIAQSPATEFIDGKIWKFSTRGHPKAKGAGFTLKLPNSWAAKEGARRDVVQRFVSESGRGSESIVISTTALRSAGRLDDADLKAVVSSVLSAEEMKDLVPENGTFIRATPTKIGHVPAGLLEYSLRQAGGGVEIDLHAFALTFFQRQTMVQIQCQVVGPSSKASEMPTRVAAFRPLFELVMNSVEFEEK